MLVGIEVVKSERGYVENGDKNYHAYHI